MPRLAPLLALALAMTACHAPAYLSFTSHAASEATSTGESASSSTGGSDAFPPVMSSDGHEGSDSGTTTSTTDGPDDTGASTGTSSTTTTSSTSTTGAPSCGDGLVDGDEECDDANSIDDDRCANNCTKNRWIFATAAHDLQGDLGGIAVADSYCQQYALQSGRADDSWLSFIAWLSDADHDVRDRLHPGLGRYVRTDGVTVADNFTQLLSGTLNAPIEIDEHGEFAPGAVLTGTRPDGTAAPGSHCENWTSSSLLDFSANIGNTAFTDGNWTMEENPEVNPTSCAPKSYRLYCVEGM